MIVRKTNITNEMVKNEKTFKEVAQEILNFLEGSVIVSHNIKFDLHMLNNIDIKTPDDIHYIDTMLLIRLAHDALTPENGGPSLGLKEYACKYIDKSAKQHEHLVKEERTVIAKGLNKTLKDKIYNFNSFYFCYNS